MSYAPLYGAQAMSRRYNVLERAAGRVLVWSNDHRTRAGVRSERNPKRLHGNVRNR